MKALSEDPAFAARAEAVLLAADLDPARVQPDLSLSRPRLPDLETFRRRVDPLLYEERETTEACAHCHASHTILRIAEPDPAMGKADEQVLINYNSVLKVVNLGQPESSLLLRKPLSPQNRADGDPADPAGLTHAGGQIWKSTEDPAYKAILDWIREATRAAEGTRKTEVTNVRKR